MKHLFLVSLLVASAPVWSLDSSDNSTNYEAYIGKLFVGECTDCRAVVVQANIAEPRLIVRNANGETILDVSGIKNIKSARIIGNLRNATAFVILRRAKVSVIV